MFQSMSKLWKSLTQRFRFQSPMETSAIVGIGWGIWQQPNMTLTSTITFSDPHSQIVPWLTKVLPLSFFRKQKTILLCPLVSKLFYRVILFHNRLVLFEMRDFSRRTKFVASQLQKSKKCFFCCPHSTTDKCRIDFILTPWRQKKELSSSVCWE